MITELKVIDADHASPPWWNKVEALKGLESIKFAPGLNILIGANGSGKSTVLQSMARMLHCEQGGVQKVTQTSVWNIRGEGFSSCDPLRAGVLPIHDGQPVMYCSPDKAVGLDGGQFDGDFQMEGIQNTIVKGSSGQITAFRLEKALRVIVGEEAVPAVDWSVRISPEETDEIKRILEGDKTEGPSRQTILLDEPDRSLDMNRQFIFWLRTAIAAKNRLQIIVAAHSPMVFFLPDVNFIELTPGYKDLIQMAVHKFSDTEKLSFFMEALEKEGKPKKAPEKPPKKKSKKS